jgi:adenosylhomocysteine nucleosidase
VTVLNIVCALPCEARPIIKRFGLELRDAGGNFRLYASDDQTLVVSGDGKTPAAAAVGYLMGRAAGSAPPAWLSVGIAGHGTRAIGDAILSHKVTDDATGDVFYPTFVFEAPCPTDNLLTVDQPVGRDRPYPDNTVCDMEGSAVFAAACRFSPLEIVHALKIVSDNAAANVDHLTAELAESLVEKHMDLVEDVVTKLLELQGQLAEAQSAPQQLEMFLNHWRFSATQARQLEGHLRRWQSLSRQESVDWKDYRELANARLVITRLESEIDNLPLHL